MTPHSPQSQPVLLVRPSDVVPAFLSPVRIKMDMMMDSVLKDATAIMAQYRTSLESVCPPQNALVSSSVHRYMGSMWFGFFEVWNFSGHLGFIHDY